MLVEQSKCVFEIIKLLAGHKWYMGLGLGTSALMLQLNDLVSLVAINIFKWVM